VVVDLRIAGGTVVTVDPDHRVVREDVYVDRGRIVAVGGPRRPARRTLDATGMVVMPGMVNLHDHLRDLTPGIRLGEGLKLDALLRRYWELGRAAGAAEYRVGAALLSAKLLRAGVTSVVDHLYTFHSPGLAEASVEGYAATGVRWFLARGIMTRPYRPISESIRTALKGIRDLADRVVPRERLFVAPVSFRQAVPAEYVQARRLADRLGLRTYTHVAETPAEVETVRREHGARPVELLHRIGFAGADTTLVHCVYLSAREVRMLARSGATVVHCPSNHMRLAKGVSPVPALLRAGANVGLGVDMMDDLFAEMRQEVLMQGLHHSDPGVITPRTALEMATARGAVGLGLGQELGRIEPGRRADLVCVDLSAPHLQPVLDPVWTLVHRAHGHDVAHVVVDGEVVVRDGRLVRVDEEALVEEAREVTRSYLRRAGVQGEQVWDLGRPRRRPGGGGRPASGPAPARSAR
jgi:5-methylthioadenosine/S-adenosylhomocysteine deaminase